MDNQEIFSKIKKELLDLIDEVKLPRQGTRDPEFDEEKYNNKLLRLIEAAQELGVYPQETVEGNPNSILAMVKGYGARWFEWREPCMCNNCTADLRDHKAGPPYKREIGIVEYDRVKRFICPDCKVTLGCSINNGWSGTCKNHTRSCRIKH